MKRLIFLVIASALLLASCGGSSKPSAADYDLTTKDGVSQYAEAYFTADPNVDCENVTVNGEDDNMIVLVNLDYFGNKREQTARENSPAITNSFMSELEKAGAPIYEAAFFFDTDFGALKVAYEGFSQSELVSEF